MKPIIIAVVNRKGGVAKTTTVVNVGALLASRGYKTLAIDFDIQLNLTSYLSCQEQPERDIYGAVTGQDSYDEATFNTSVEGLQLIAGSDRLGEFDFSKYSLRKHLKALDQDVILIDTSPYFNDQIAVTLAAADTIIIPTTADDDSVEGLLNTIEEFKAINNHRDFKYKVLLTKVEKDSMTRQIVDEIQHYFHESLFKTCIRFNSAAIRKARSVQLPVALKYKHSKAAIDYTALVDEIEEEVLCQD